MTDDSARSAPVLPDVELVPADVGPLGSEVDDDDRWTETQAPALDLADCPFPLVYRRYRPGRTPPTRSRLLDLVRLRLDLHPATRERLDATVRWPLRTGVADGAVDGIVLRAVPGSFHQAMTLPSGARRVVRRDLGHLVVDPERARRLALPSVTTEDRLKICLAIAEALAALHEMGTGAGDLEADRILFRTRPAAEVMVTGVASAPSPSETYLLGQHIARVLGPGLRLDAAEQAAGAVLGPEGATLLSRALSGPAADRPEARAWADLLTGLPGIGRPPTIEDVEIDRTLVPVGDAVTVRWWISSPATVEVVAPGSSPVRLAPGGTSGSLRIVPQRSGPIVLGVANSSGHTERTVARVAVLDLPRQASLPVHVPRPDWPGHLPDLPDVGALLPPLPRDDTAEIPAAISPAGILGSDQPVGPRPPLAELSPPPGFDVGQTMFPVDIAAIMSASPPLHRRRRGRKR